MSRQRAPSAPAASSTSTTSGETASTSSSQARGRPKRCTASTARVRAVDGVVDACRVEVEGLGIDVDEDRPRARERDDVRGGGKRVGRHEDLVARARDRARAPRGGAQPSRTRRRPRARRRTRARARPRARHLRAHRQLARLEHLGDRRRLGGTDVRPREPDQASAGFRSRYQAIVLDRPSSSSTFASKPSTCAGLVDVRDPQLDVGVVERLEPDLAGDTGESPDPRRRGRRWSPPSARCRC